MKKILLMYITTVFLLADGGSVQNYYKKIQLLSEKQEKIKKHLLEIENFLNKYDRFAKSYLAQLKSIVIDGAQCEIDKEKYLYYKRTKGEDNKFTIIRKGMYDDCYKMKAIRLKAIQNVKVKVQNLKMKVDEILELKEIDMDEANRIKEYIDTLRHDIKYYKNIDNM